MKYTFQADKKIEECADCPLCDYWDDGYDFGYSCALNKNTTIRNVNSKPKWCKLKESEVEG